MTSRKLRSKGVRRIVFACSATFTVLYVIYVVWGNVPKSDWEWFFAVVVIVIRGIDWIIPHPEMDIQICVLDKGRF